MVYIACHALSFTKSHMTLQNGSSSNNCDRLADSVSSIHRTNRLNFYFCLAGMADEGGEVAAASVDQDKTQHSDDYHNLVKLGLDTRVAAKLEDIFVTGEAAVCLT